MRRMVIIFAGVLLLPFAMVFVGCGKSATPSAASHAGRGDASEEHADQDHASHGHGEATQQSAQDGEITAALAELPTKDRALAVKQRICPVSGELLGSMGAPVTVDVKGQAVFICCDGCREKLLAKPDEYLAKIKK